MIQPSHDERERLAKWLEDDGFPGRAENFVLARTDEKAREIALEAAHAIRVDGYSDSWADDLAKELEGWARRPKETS